MSRMQWAERVLGTTRGQIVGLLCYRPRTVGEVSRHLNLTPNGVRDHLAALQADGLVKRAGEKRQVGKPAHLFELTASGRFLSSTAYQPVLHGLLDALAQGTTRSLNEIVRDAGQRVAANYPKAAGDLRARAKKGAAALRELGGDTEVVEDGNAFVIRGVCCPLGDIVPEHPEMCKLIEAMLSEVMGAAVTEFCHKTEPLTCGFRLRAAEASTEKKLPKGRR